MQAYFSAETFEYPLVPGIAINSQLTPLDDLAAVAVELDVSDYTDLEGTVNMLSKLGILP
jgi:hypothetical protein